MRTGVLARNHIAARGRSGVRFPTLLRRRGGVGRLRRIASTVTPRGTDWSLALLVALGLATGVATWFAGSPQSAWVFAAHAAGGAALALVLVWKLRRVRPRIAARARWDGRTGFGLAALLLAASVLASGAAWSNGLDAAFGGMSLLGWHVLAGAFLGGLVLLHAVGRARPLRRADVRDRRQFLAASLVGAAAIGAWALQRPVQRLAGVHGADRRFTGSYTAGSFTGNDFPVTSWVADHPRPLSAARYRLAVAGEVVRALSVRLEDLDRGDEIVATLDCTGGFASTQRWRGVRIGRLLDEAGVAPAGAHVRVVSVTGYRWGFALADARDLVLATHVGDEPLTHGHGAPCRLVVPGHRGFQWVKWVTQVEVTADADLGAAASTVWSSLTPEGRGAR
jgi:DMSO/TMAO reductase YedYZ molybdopterin-dependent catalytic subunit